MKPRLLPAPETEEDNIVWNHVARVFSDQYGSTARAWNILGVSNQDSDRRDADLVLRLTQRQEYERSVAEEFGRSWTMPAAIFGIYFDPLTGERRDR